MEKQEIRQTIILENFSRLRYLSLIFISYSLFVLVCDFAPVNIWNEKYIGIYRILDLFFTLLSLFILLFFWFYRKDNYSVKNFVIKLTVFFVLLWAGVVSGIELTSLGFSALILLMLVAVFFMYFDFLTSLVLFLGTFFSVIGTVILMQSRDENLIPMLASIFPVTIISILLSARNHQAKVNELTNSNNLKRLNDELSHIKEHLEEEVKKRTYELLAAKEKAEESDRLKSAFLANMSHEIRTPMNGILGFADLLKTPNLSGEKQKEYIQIIEKGGERMLNTINNLVNISKIESGLMEVSFSETNVEKQLQFIYIFFKPEAERSGLQLILNSSLTAEESMVITDQEKLYAILTNLVKNALKYSEKGFIEMGCSTQITAETRPVVSLRFYVKDTGIGIAKDRQEAIFERFVQADIADHEARQGSGLGLSIARSYVEMLGGTIGVESEEGKGSNFFFTIPHHSIPSKAIDIKTITRSTLSEQNQKQFTILIAEDDEISEKFLSVTIGKFARTIFRTKTGTETVEICRSHPEIDLILMDIQMPELNGYEATAQIRHFNKNVIIVAQTAFALAGDKEKALAAGCNDYVSKPIKENVINDIIIKYLNLEI